MADSAPRPSPIPRELLSPAPLAAVALLAANDHLLKARWPGFLTGKLSDVAGCFVLPLFLSALLALVTRWSPRVRLALGASATIAFFSAIKLSPAAADAVAGALAVLGGGAGRIVADPTDLAALPFAVLGLWYGLRAGEGRAPRLPLARPARFAVLAATFVVLTATARVRYCPPDSFVGATLRAETDCGPPGDVVLRVEKECRVSLEGAEAVGLPAEGDRSDLPGDARGTITLIGSGPLGGVAAPAGQVQHNYCTLTADGDLLRADCRSVSSATPATGPFETLRTCKGTLRPAGPAARAPAALPAR
jgi:hypothetical protein